MVKLKPVFLIWKHLLGCGVHFYTSPEHHLENLGLHRIIQLVLRDCAELELYHGAVEWSELEGTSRIICFQHHPPDQVAQGPIHPGLHRLGHFESQGWGLGEEK